MPYETILFEKLENIGIITLNRPDEMNTMTSQFFSEMGDAVTAAANDSKIRVVVLKAKGKMFSAGGDLEMLKSLDTILKAKAMVSKDGNIIQKIYDMPKPVICAVQGVAAGSGANMALSCDFVIASEKAAFAQVFINIGGIPDSGGMWSLAKCVGVTRAKELAMSGRLVKAQEALSYGMVLKVVPEDNLEEETMAFARELASKPPVAMGYIKQIANKLNCMDMATYCALESDLMAIALQTKDHKEGMAAFIEKRKPVFTGE
ncbi:MAG TPA: enoyl-CoA hydratase/isomerase family protein [Deltaproteobacteria bacterium]|nr:enoyl-CoA hydratase/isomerase family protein [Deltaproteobacteria bacterium]